MKKALFLFIFLLILLTGCSNLQNKTVTGAAAKEQTATSAVKISFSYQKQDGFASNQVAVWIEDMQGKYVNTVYATQWTAKGGYEKRPNSLMLYVERSGLAQMDEKQVDAFAGATPTTGKLSYTWDLKNAKGEKVADGRYNIFLEGTLRDQKCVVYVAEVNVGGAAAKVHPTPEYSGEESEERGMLKDVFVEYIPLK